jgi:hypothetical protein
MKIYSSGKRVILPSVLAAILLLTWLLLPGPGLALMAIPDIGIDFKALKVVDAGKLIAAGMKNAVNGDSVSMRSSPKDGKIVIKNLRTGEELDYPPAEHKGKEK